MSPTTLVLPDWIAIELARVAKEPLESAGVILVGVARTSCGLRLLGAQLHCIPDDGYNVREGDRLAIPSQSYVALLALAEAAELTPVFFHTHPGAVGDPRPSVWDDAVDDELCETFRIRSGSDIYASLVFSPSGSWFSFTGRVRDGEEELAITRVFIAGDRMALIHSFDISQPALDHGMFDRSIRAFGGAVQRALGELRVGVVGCGGTGSAVAEQLIRLGARSVLLVDPDVIAHSNVTRVYGSTPQDVGRPKVEVLADHLISITPGGAFSAVTDSVIREKVARELTSCDVLFGCTDDNAGRLILTRLAAYYLVPVIDCGVLISSTAGHIDAVHGRVTVQTPGAACLVCRNRIDLVRAAAEQLPVGEWAARRKEGYAPELLSAEPAVVSFTTAVAAQAVTELLDRLVGFGPEPMPTEILLRFHDREVGRNRLEPRPHHLCDTSAGYLAAGDRDPFLGQLWSAES